MIPSSFVYEHFKDDPIVKLIAAQEGATDVDREELTALARALDVRADLSSPVAVAETARAVHLAYALRTGIRVIEKALAYAQSNGKKMLILLSCAEDSVVRAYEGKPRLDQPVVDFLRSNDIRFVDGMDKHREDYRAFRLSPQEYVKRYYIGHYTPRRCPDFR